MLHRQHRYNFICLVCFLRDQHHPNYKALQTKEVQGSTSLTTIAFVTTCKDARKVIYCLMMFYSGNRSRLELGLVDVYVQNVALRGLHSVLVWLLGKELQFIQSWENLGSLHMTMEFSLFKQYGMRGQLKKKSFLIKLSRVLTCYNLLNTERRINRHSDAGAYIEQSWSDTSWTWVHASMQGSNLRFPKHGVLSAIQYISIVMCDVCKT
jgi:hypothetical protein